MMDTWATRLDRDVFNILFRDKVIFSRMPEYTI